MVGITFSDVITFSGDTDVVLELPMYQQLDEMQHKHTWCDHRLVISVMTFPNNGLFPPHLPL